eukprot:bmy_17230T0
MPCDSDVLTFRQQRTESTANGQKSTLSCTAGVRPVERVFICNFAYEVVPALKAVFDEKSLFPKEILDQFCSNTRKHSEIFMMEYIEFLKPLFGKVRGGFGGYFTIPVVWTEISLDIRVAKVKMDKILLWSLLLTFSGSQASSPLAQRNTEFAVDLYQAVCLSHKNNIIISPFGTTLALGMVQLGAKGITEQQIRQSLRFQETSTGEEFSVLKSFFSAISEKKQEFTFNLANALYLQEGFAVKEQYLHGNKEFFQSAIKLVDFQNAKACAETISTWVESKTDGKIKNIFSGEEFGPLTRLVLVNAIYFKGDWKQKFRKEDTRLMNFTQKYGAAVKIPMMKTLLRTKYGYFSESSMNYQVLELPYKGDEFSLIIILPAEDVNIEEMEKLITAHQILQWFSEMQEEEVEISLPSSLLNKLLLLPNY